MGGRLSNSHEDNLMKESQSNHMQSSELNSSIQGKMIRLTLEAAAIRIQTCFRKLKKQKKIKKVKLVAHQVLNSVGFQKKQNILQNFNCTRFPINELNKKNLNLLGHKLTQSYLKMFECSALNSLSSKVCFNSIVYHQAELVVDSGKEFEEKNRHLILGFMFINKELAEKFSGHMNNCRNQEPKLIEKCSCSENNKYCGSNINQQSTSNSFNTKNSVGFHSKENSDASNHSSMISFNKINKRKTYSAHFISSLKETKCSKANLIMSESVPSPYFHSIIKLIEENSLDAENLTEYDKDLYMFEGLVLQSEKIGVGFYFRFKPEKKRKYIYYGYFNHGKFDGIGVLLKDNGYSYEGEFRDGRRTGYGYECQLSKFTYDGFFHNDQYNGYGILINIEKSTSYYGNFIDGKKEGWGYNIYLDGCKYSGEFTQDQRSGTGLMIWKEGHSYHGSWSKDKMHGIGDFRFKQGDQYQGQFASGIKHGLGIYTYKTGATLKGRWYNGRKEGNFIFSSVDGTKSKLEYKNDLQI